MAAWQKSVSETHIRCSTTASLRASATSPRLAPRRCATRTAQDFSVDHFATRVMITCAASNSAARTAGSPAQLIAPTRSPEPLIAKISQETLADMIGTTRSRVSFFMNKFRDLGFIDYNGGIRVHSSLLSVVLLDQPHIKT